MKQLNFMAPKELSWLDVPPPTITEDHMVLVRPLTVATCDMDGVAIQGLMPLKGPTPLGHEGEGIITDIGSAVTCWKEGDRVIIPWKVACGGCKACSRTHTAQCSSVPPEDAYGWGPSAPKWGGFISDAVAVPWADHMLTKMPDGVDPILACGVADNISDGYRCVAPHIKERSGGTVLVATMVAPGSIGLYAAGFAVALGAERVVYADADPVRLSIAEKMGAETYRIGEQGLAEFAANSRSLTGGFDITVDAAGVPELLPQLIAATGRAGVCVSSAGVMYRGRPIPMDIYSMYRKSASFHTGWVHTHSIIDEPLQMIAEGKFDPSPVTTKVVPWEEAAEALAMPFTKLLISRAS